MFNETEQTEVRLRCEGCFYIVIEHRVEIFPIFLPRFVCSLWSLVWEMAFDLVRRWTFEYSAFTLLAWEVTYCTRNRSWFDVYTRVQPEKVRSWQPKINQNPARWWITASHLRLRSHTFGLWLLQTHPFAIRQKAKHRPNLLCLCYNGDKNHSSLCCLPCTWGSSFFWLQIISEVRCLFVRSYPNGVVYWSFAQ